MGLKLIISREDRLRDVKEVYCWQQLGLKIIVLKFQSILKILWLVNKISSFSWHSSREHLFIHSFNSKHASVTKKNKSTLMQNYLFRIGPQSISGYTKFSNRVVKVGK